MIWQKKEKGFFFFSNLTRFGSERAQKYCPNRRKL
jgi:hypothetical protein